MEMTRKNRHALYDWDYTNAEFTNRSIFNIEGCHANGTSEHPFLVDAAIGVWDDVNVGSVSLGVGATAPDLVQIGTTGIYARGFNGAGATVEQLFGEMEIPHTYKEGTDLYFHVHWKGAAGGEGNVKWQLTYVIEHSGEQRVNGSTIFVTSATGGELVGVLSTFPAIPGSGVYMGDQFVFRLFRDPVDAADTYEADAIVSTVGIHHQVDTIGSRSITAK